MTIYPDMEIRVDRLEELVESVWHAFQQTDAQMARHEAKTAQYEAQMARDNARTNREITRFSQGMDEFKDEMAVFKDEMHADRKAINKQWGELANKLGTLAEDIVAPSIPRILRHLANCPSEEPDMVAVRMKRKHPTIPDLSQEFDVVAVCGKYVLITETKNKMSVEKVNDFVELMKQARGYFPEYADQERYHFLGALAALHVDRSIVRYGEKKGVLMLGLGDEMMDVLNENTETLEHF